MKVRTFLLGVLLGEALVIPALSAQNESIISGSTFGLFTDDVDDYMDPNDYENVEFDNVFIYLKGGRNSNAEVTPGTTPGFTGRINSPYNPQGTPITEEGKAGIQGGLATRFGSLYLGFAFDTNLWDGDETIEEVDGDRNDSRGSDPITFDGGFGLLVGTGNIGAFKLQLDFDKVSLDTNKNDTTGADPEKSSYSDGKLLIDLGWGKNFEVKGGVLAPEVHIGYRISTFKEETTDTDSFTYISERNLDDAPYTISTTSFTTFMQREYWFKDMSHLIIAPGVEYTSATGAHWFGGGYELDIGIHPVTIYKDGTSGKEYDWKGYDVRNTLNGEYKRNVSLTDRFALVLSGALDLQLRSSKVDYTDLPDPIEYVDFSVNPAVKLGVTYDFAKKPFQLYSALSLAPNAVYEVPATPGTTPNDTGVELDKSFYNVRYTKYTNGANDDVESWRHDFTPWGLKAGLGLKFTPIKNFSLDIGLSQNLSYYISDKLEYVWAYDLGNWQDHPFTAELQITVRF
jgi:hypothetical protein